jgi:hypothetical protein
MDHHCCLRFCNQYDTQLILITEVLGMPFLDQKQGYWAMEQLEEHGVFRT